MLTLVDPLEHARKLHAQRLAVIDGDRRLGYGELYERCRRLGAGLRALGLGRGDRVAILAANGHRYLEAFCGVPAHGMVIVPLNTRLAAPELEAIVADCQPRVLLTDRDPGPLAARVERVLWMGGNAPAPRDGATDDYERLLETARGAAEVEREENALAALFYTGGTTGLPKGVMLTHRNLVANAFHKAIACSLTGDDVFLAAPAMFHVAGIAPLLSLVWLGAVTVTVPAFDPELCLDLIARHRITLAIPVPTMIAALVAAQRKNARDVSSLRLLGHAGSSIANELIAAAHETFPASELAQFYGATETSSIVTAFRNEQAAIGTQLLGSCGRATPGVAVEVVRDDGSACEPGEVGEIVVRGPNVTAGYFRNERATFDAFRNGFYRTGDVGVLREGGYLFVVDRIKDMIVSGAENVYSIEVEAVLQRHPAVIEAAVFGIPDPVWGEAVHAIVVVDAQHGGDAAPALAAELQAHCRAAIAGYKVPKRIDVQLEPLPKSGPGKILKRALRERFASGAEKGKS